MKRVSKYIFVALALFATACNSYLDINTNPNQPTSVGPNLVLPQAQVATAQVLNRYNTYGAQVGGYASNAGGYGGFNELVSYAYTSGNFSDLWPYTYDNLEDYQYIINTTKNDPLNIYFNAVATIMRVHGFQLLVDTFNDVPYTAALKGADNLTPTYDHGADIYAGLAVELDSAMARINRGNKMTTKNGLGSYDVIFAGDMTKWLKLANTLKLKLIIRGNGKVTFANTTFDAAGFLTEDALINPGYAQDNNRQNPYWNTWAFGYTGSAGNKAWVPTTYVVSFFDGNKIQDPYRGGASFFEFGNITSNNTVTAGTGYVNTAAAFNKDTVYTSVDLSGGYGEGTGKFTVDKTGAVKSFSLLTSRGYKLGDTLSAKLPGGSGFAFRVTGVPVFSNQLGVETVNAPKCPTGSRWYSGLDRTGGATSGNTYGILKGPTAGVPLLTAAEANFLLAEGALNGLVGLGVSDAAAFNNGIAASFNYLFQLPNKSLHGNPAAMATKYIADNTGNMLVNYSKAVTTQDKLAAIITQKYIALNFIHSHEGWNEYRRTGYPVQQNWTGQTTNPTATFASVVSQSPRADHLPTRILYPVSEAQYNPANNPTGISPFTSLIFWAK